MLKGDCVRVISVKNLHKNFDNLEILKGVSIDVEKGERVVILGQSGSGKSTMLRCMNLLEVPSYGEVWLDDQIITDIDPYLHDDIIKESKTYKKLREKSSADVTNEQIIEEIKTKRLLQKIEGKSYRATLKSANAKLKIDENLARRRVGMVFQHFNLFNNMTVKKNLVYAPLKLNLLNEEQAEKKATALLERIGLVDKAEEYPASLSGGQKQRIAIARSLMLNPEVILFDEPTSALDPVMVGEVLELIKELANEGMSMVIVTHEIGFAKEVATEVVFMHEGLIVEKAPPKEFFQNPQTSELKEFLSKVL